MADEVLVKTVSATLTPANPSVSIVTSTHTLSLAPSEPFAASEGNEMLLKSDIDASFATYTTNYSTLTYSSIPGMLIYQSLKSIDGLSELVKKNGDPVALKTTTGTITCAVQVSATFTPPTPATPQTDSTTTYDLDFSFTDAAQTLTKSD